MATRIWIRSTSDEPQRRHCRERDRRDDHPAPPIEDDLAEIKHPLSAIMANADAARRWLNRTNPNFYEAIAALDRIVRESIRIDDTISGIRALPAAESPAKRLV
jgi:hypothetical protein